jgi:hypothetical protein
VDKMQDCSMGLELSEKEKKAIYTNYSVEYSTGIDGLLA